MKLFIIIVMSLLFVAPFNAEAKASKGKAKTATKTTKTDPASLFNRLGGMSGVTAVVDQFVANCAGDARIANFFSGTAADASRLSKFKKNLVEQICQVSGGPCKYVGKDMKAAHLGMGVKNEDFDALVEDMTAALNQYKVGANEQADLLKVLASLRGQIVEHKA